MTPEEPRTGYMDCMPPSCRRPRGHGRKECRRLQDRERLASVRPGARHRTERSASRGQHKGRTQGLAVIAVASARYGATATGVNAAETDRGAVCASAGPRTAEGRSAVGSRRPGSHSTEPRHSRLLGRLGCPLTGDVEQGDHWAEPCGSLFSLFCRDMWDQVAHIRPSISGGPQAAYSSVHNLSLRHLGRRLSNGP